MWYFYAIAVPVVLGLVVYTLQHFASPKVLIHVKVVVTYAWFINMSIVILVPFDVWTTICRENRSLGMTCSDPAYINLLWSLTYWSAFFLTWLIIPMIQGYEDAADFTMSKRIKTSVRGNLIFYSSVGTIGLVGAIILLATKELAWDNLLGLAIGASNAFGLVTGALLLGFGLIELPRGLWRHADLNERAKWLSHKVGKVAEKLDEAHQELSTAIVITQATSNQMSRRDPLRPMMDIIDAMANEDMLFKPSGGRLGESDMDYDTDEKSMAALRHRLRRAQDMYSRYKTEYTSIVWQALEVEDTIKNVESGKTGERQFLSRLKAPRNGVFAPAIDTIEWYWRCVVSARVMQASAAVLAAVSVAIISGEATMLFHKWFDLSLFSVLIRSAGLQEETVQALVFTPLIYICVCTYFSVFKLGMFSFYYLVPRHTDSVSLLMNCSMVSRYAAPMCYNFLSLIHLTHINKRTHKKETLTTTFEDRMSVLPEEYESIYPLVMVVWCLLIYGNVHNRIMDVFGSWKKLRFESDEDFGEGDGSSSTGLIILRRERASLERGAAIGENVVPLARNFAHAELDVESQALKHTENSKADLLSDSKSLLSDGDASSKLSGKDAMASLYKTLKESTPGLPTISTQGQADKKFSNLKDGSHKAIAAKYANMRSGNRTPPKPQGMDARPGFDFGRSGEGRASSEDLITLGHEPFSSGKFSDRSALIGRSPKAPFRHTSRSQPISPPNELFRSGDQQQTGLLDSQWEAPAMPNKPASEKAELAAAKEVPTDAEADLEAIFSGLNASRGYSDDEDSGSLLRHGGKGIAKSSGRDSFRFV